MLELGVNNPSTNQPTDGKLGHLWVQLSILTADRPGMVEQQHTDAVQVLLQQRQAPIRLAERAT